jgi:hypothetical protein
MNDTWLELTTATIHQRDLIRDAERERLVRMAQRLRRKQSWWYHWWQRLFQLVRRTSD